MKFLDCLLHWPYTVLPIQGIYWYKNICAPLFVSSVLLRKYHATRTQILSSRLHGICILGKAQHPLDPLLKFVCKEYSLPTVYPITDPCLGPRRDEIPRIFPQLICKSRLFGLGYAPIKEALFSSR